MKVRAFLVPIGTGVLGLAIGLLINWQPSQNAASIQSLGIAARDAQQLVAAKPVTNANGGITAAEIRQIVREELAANASSVKLISGAVSNKHVDQQVAGGGDITTPTQPSVAQMASASKMRLMVDAAIARRQWTERDVEQLRSELDSLTTEQRSDLVQKIVVAINSGQLIPQTDQLF